MKSNIQNKQKKYQKLMKASNTPDIRDQDKGINKWVAFFAILFIGIIWYAIHQLISLI